MNKLPPSPTPTAQRPHPPRGKRLRAVHHQLPALERPKEGSSHHFLQEVSGGGGGGRWWRGGVGGGGGGRGLVVEEGGGW